VIRVTITPRRIEVRGHASTGWCTAISTVLDMLQGRAIKWCHSPSERRNHYVIQRHRDALDESAIQTFAALALTASLGRRPEISLVVRPGSQARRRKRRSRR